jgi:hypothetical protein
MGNVSYHSMDIVTRGATLSGLTVEDCILGAPLGHRRRRLQLRPLQQGRVALIVAIKV